MGIINKKNKNKNKMDFKTFSLLTAVLLAATTLTNVSQVGEFAEFQAKFGK